jgi:hypothetical protein
VVYPPGYVAPQTSYYYPQSYYYPTPQGYLQLRTRGLSIGVGL